MRIGSLFSGAGGLDMAVEEVFGGEVIWQSEMDKAASTVLEYRFPCAPNWGDITAINWKKVQPVDVLCGGYPCQPFSHAGKRKGTDDERHLWPYFADAIRALRPRYAVLENVAGHRSMGFDSVLADLAEMRYDAQWVCLRASDIGAPHRRERLFVIASDTGYRSESERAWASGREIGERTPVGAESRPGCGTSADAHVDDSARRLDAAAVRRVESENSRPRAGIDGTPGRFTGDRGEADSGDVELLPTPTTQDGANNGGPSQFERNTRPLNAEVTLLPTPSLSDSKTPRRGDHLLDTLDNGTHTVNLSDAIEHTHGRDALLCTPSASDGADGKTSRSGGRIDEPLLGGQAREMHTTWGKYAPAIRRWEALTRPAPAPTEPNKNGNPRLSAAFSEWMMGWPPGWVTDPDIGISRNDQLRIIGNGVCPQQAIAALRFLLSVSAVAA